MAPIECQWPDQMKLGNRVVSTPEYVAYTLRSKNVYICCDDCLEKMPDIKIEDLIDYKK